MSLASRITDAIDALITALNARNAPGASDYQVWLAQGNTGSIDNYRASILGADQDFAAQFNAAIGTTPSAKVATEAQAGITQLASTAEAQAGNAAKAISAARALDVLNANQDAVAALTGFRRGTDAQRTALTSAQVFPGLLYLTTDTGITWKYVGVGNTNLGATDTTSAWQAWDKPGIAYTPSFTNLGWTAANASVMNARWGISAGQFWTTVFEGQTNASTTNTTSDVTINLPSPMVGLAGVGTGFYIINGSSAANNQVALYVYSVGSGGQATSAARIRPLISRADGTAVRANAGLYAQTGSNNGDQLFYSIIAPSGLVS